MIEITKWSNPEITAEIPGEVSLENISEISAKIKLGKDSYLEKLYSKGEVTLDGQTLTVPLSQEETGKFKGTPILQVNLYFSDGTRLPSQEEPIRTFRNFKQEVME